MKLQNEITPKMKFTSDVVIGLECHAELDTKSKLFCGCPTRAPQGSDEVPNSRCCPVCLGHPGSKPVLNKRAVDCAIKLCLALNCKISPQLIFSRKSYFYPDMAKNYQISQYEMPLGSDGTVSVGEKNIGITRVHIEEDPASLVHPAGMKDSGYVLVDYNRSGCPLAEIVTMPEMTTPQHARDFMRQLISILKYLEIFDENHGIIKADANISVKESGYSRVEIKNITGFKEIQSALTYEIARQKSEIAQGKKIVAETRGWDAQNSVTFSLRTKETEEDYGYIIDTDLTATDITLDWIAQIRKGMPEFADDKTKKYIGMGVKQDDAAIIAADKSVAEFFEQVAQEINAVLAAKWVRRELLRVLNYNKKTLADISVTPKHLINLLKLVTEKKITEAVGSKILEKLVEEPFDVTAYVAREKLEVVSDSGELETLCTAAIAESPAAVADYKSGGQKALNFIIGKVMAKTRGKADPAVVKEIILQKIER